MYCPVLNKSIFNLKLNPLQLGKQIYWRVENVIAIKPACPAGVKLFLESIITANNFLNSFMLVELKWSVFIFSTLIYSYGVTRLDQSVSKKDFWGGVETSIGLIELKRIPFIRDSVKIESKLVVLKFKLTLLPDFISTYRVRVKLDPSFRSLTQYKQCSCFGHTRLENFGVCAASDHQLTDCPIRMSR